ncbi:hypothetical protein LXL04_006616 [Taraxacum kok-saghyz]
MEGGWPEVGLSSLGRRKMLQSSEIASNHPINTYMVVNSRAKESRAHAAAVAVDGGIASSEEEAGGVAGKMVVCMPEGIPQQLLAAVAHRGRPPEQQLVAGCRGWQKIIGTEQERPENSSSSRRKSGSCCWYYARVLDLECEELNARLSKELAKKVWHWVLKWCDISVPTVEKVEDLLVFISKWGNYEKKRRDLMCISYGTLWLIWKARCNWVFKKLRSSPIKVADNVKNIVQRGQSVKLAKLEGLSGRSWKIKLAGHFWKKCLDHFEGRREKLLGIDVVRHILAPHELIKSDLNGYKGGKLVEGGSTSASSDPKASIS